MLPSLLFLLLRRYQRKHPEKARLFCTRLHVAARVVLLVLLTAGIAVYAFSQERVLHYVVKRNGNSIGNLVLKETKADNRTTYKLQSAVKSSFLFTLTVKALEEAIYENGILTYSLFYQKVNSSERANTRIQATGAAYKVTEKQETTLLKRYPITYNMVCLYTMEPAHVRQVFMDKYQKFVPIETISPHHYKIVFPDGASNEYYYQAGICVKVKLNSTWFSAVMELHN
jgi:hypothetical protein